MCYEIEDHPRISQRLISLSRTCLALESPIENTSLIAIHAMLLHTTYFYVLEEPSAYGKGDVCCAIAMKLAQTVSNAQSFRYISSFSQIGLQ
jgi:hypothetical protein